MKTEKEMIEQRKMTQRKERNWEEERGEGRKCRKHRNVRYDVEEEKRMADGEIYGGCRRKSGKRTEGGDEKREEK